VIEKEPKNTEFNPFFERALGKHEKIEPVRFTEKSQFDQLGKYINGVLQAEKDEHTEAMSFDVRLLKLLEVEYITSIQNIVKLAKKQTFSCS
jgi:hypothetical protein